MKKISIVLTAIALFITSCSNSEVSKLQITIDSLSKESQDNKNMIALLRDSIEIMRYTSQQRFEIAKSYIESGDLNKAENEINQIKRIFPNSQEAATCSELSQRIEKIKKEKIAEEKRIKALGFKAIKQKTSFSIDYNKINLSNFSISKKFVFDAYDDRWHYQDADRDNKYITMAMSITSSSKSPNIPQLAVYKINGDKLDFAGSFITRYARWSDYGSYLGNYSDSRNNFSKVSTVHFKLGCEVSESITKGSFAIVAMNKNVLIENYESFNNPPKFWTGSADYPKTLSVSSFDKDYTLVKIYNLN